MYLPLPGGQRDHGCRVPPRAPALSIPRTRPPLPSSLLAHGGHHLEPSPPGRAPGAPSVCGRASPRCIARTWSTPVARAAPGPPVRPTPPACWARSPPPRPPWFYGLAVCATSAGPTRLPTGATVLGVSSNRSALRTFNDGLSRDSFSGGPRPSHVQLGDAVVVHAHAAVDAGTAGTAGLVGAPALAAGAAAVAGNTGRVPGHAQQIGAAAFIHSATAAARGVEAGGPDETGRANADALVFHAAVRAQARVDATTRLTGQPAGHPSGGLSAITMSVGLATSALSMGSAISVVPPPVPELPEVPEVPPGSPRCHRARPVPPVPGSSPPCRPCHRWVRGAWGCTFYRRTDCLRPARGP